MDPDSQLWYGHCSWTPHRASWWQCLPEAVPQLWCCHRAMLLLPPSSACLQYTFQWWGLLLHGRLWHESLWQASLLPTRSAKGPGTPVVGHCAIKSFRTRVEKLVFNLLLYYHPLNPELAQRLSTIDLIYFELFLFCNNWPVFLQSSNSFRI